ncbi:hypothetical protein VAZ01S_082_00040 [Vibrio azureus NBRC 104587]|uniref:Uncharacterized protein n=1 Tax=Vibrio azureus NBRC 104587 TaxID=1219077 RepID=U3AV28_9VIBR|nr:hypothetical protein VAZ01S_082_00040 [Vibrio azureus NBRC 104587]
MILPFMVHVQFKSADFIQSQQYVQFCTLIEIKIVCSVSFNHEITPNVGCYTALLSRQKI